MVRGKEVTTFCFGTIRAKESMFGALVEYSLAFVVVGVGCAVGELDAVMLSNGGNGP
jgi:hypothetical protein